MPDARASFCPAFQKAVELVGRRWSGTIRRALMIRPLRFSETRVAVPQISDRALSVRLKELEREAVIARRVEASQPVRISYELTDKGRDLESVITAIERWADDWIAAARSAADGTSSRIA
jgi:DNA-binding HxlR family transcriptional regulator